MKKSFIIKLLSLIMVICAGLSLIACGDPGNNPGGNGGGNGQVVLKDWQAQVTRTVDLGSIISVGSDTVEDTDGNMYFCDYIVQDSQGNRVIPISGQFEVTDAAGYTITCSVVISSDDTRVQTIKIKITDTVPPTIKFNEVKTGFINKEYTLPEIIISDLSGDGVDSVVKVYKVADDTTKTEVAISNNKFVPTEKGKYVVEVTATDSSNNTATAEQVFAVRDAMAENVLEDFNDSLSLLNSKNGDGVEWLSEYEGHTGVIKIPGSTTDITPYCFLFAQAREDYKYLPFTSIKVTFYASKRGDWYPTTVNPDDAAPYWYSAPSQTWTTWEITNIVDWNLFFSTGTNGTGAQLFWSWTKGMDVYIDEITYTASPEITIVPNKTEGDAGDEISVSAFVENDNRFTPTITVKDPNGNNVEVVNNKFTITIYGDYTITATIDGTEVSYLKSVCSTTVKCLTNYIKYEAFDASYGIGQDVFISDGIWYNPSTQTAVSNSNVTYVVKHGNDEITITEGKFVPSVAGLYTVTYTATVGSDIVATTTAEILVLELTAGPDMLANFREANSASQFVSGTTAEWLPEFEGKAGVVKVQGALSGNIYNHWFKSTAIPSGSIAAGDWDYLEIEFYMSVSKWLFVGGTDLVTQSKVNTWNTIKVTKSQIIANDGSLTTFANSITGGGYNLLWVYKDSTPVDAIYFNSVRLGKVDIVGSGSYTFDTAADNDNFTNGSSKIGEWMETYNDRTGVVKVNADDAWGWSNLYIRARNIVADEIILGDWDYIELQVFFTVNGKWLYWGYGGGRALNISTKIGEWNTIKITREFIEANSNSEGTGGVASMASAFTGTNGYCVLIAEGLGDMYFDSIKFCKNA